MLGHYSFKLVETLSRGTIVIMAFHGLIFLYVPAIFRHLFSLDFVFSTLGGKFLLAGLSLLLLYFPIIWFQNYFPIVIGNRK